MYDQAPSPSREYIYQFPWLSDEESAELDESVKAYTRLLVKGTIEELDVIDTTITSLLINWDIKRVSIIDLSILRLSIYSLLYQKDIPQKVVIHEAILLCQELSSSKAYSFINGILDAYVKRNKGDQ